MCLEVLQLLSFNGRAATDKMLLLEYSFISYVIIIFLSIFCCQFYSKLSLIAPFFDKVVFTQLVNLNLLSFV